MNSEEKRIKRIDAALHKRAHQLVDRSIRHGRGDHSVCKYTCPYVWAGVLQSSTVLYMPEAADHTPIDGVPV
jgi:hypothetical protein